MSLAESPPRMNRLKNQMYRLIGEVCENDHKIFPPRDICPECAATLQKPFQFSGRGEIYSWTRLHQAPAGFEDQAPYYVAMIRLEEGPLITARLTDVDTPKIGMPVEMVTRKLSEDGDEGLISYGYSFRPQIPRE